MSPEAVEIRDAARALFAGNPLFKTTGIVRTGLEPDDDLPALIFMLKDERLTSLDGQAFAGAPTFQHNLTITSYVSLFGNDREKVQARLITRTQAVLNGLLTNPDFLASVDGISEVRESQLIANEGEKYYGHASIEITMHFQKIWEPVIPDDYEGASITARPIGHGPNTPGVFLRIDEDED